MADLGAVLLQEENLVETRNRAAAKCISISETT
jgi:hypothetical protein